MLPESSHSSGSVRSLSTVGAVLALAEPAEEGEGEAEAEQEVAAAAPAAAGGGEHAAGGEIWGGGGGHTRVAVASLVGFGVRVGTRRRHSRVTSHEPSSWLLRLRGRAFSSPGARWIRREIVWLVMFSLRGLDGL